MCRQDDERLADILASAQALGAHLERGGRDGWSPPPGSSRKTSGGLWGILERMDHEAVPSALSLGIDLATTNGATGICEIDWQARSAVVEVRKPTNDELRSRITAVSAGGGWTAIDAPFGFPAAFSRAVEDWRRLGRVQPALDTDIIRRITDRQVQARQMLVSIEIRGTRPMWPLSSVVERITPTTVRAMQLLSGLSEHDLADRVGLTTHVVETYPIAALRVWGVLTRDYKTKPEDADSVLEHLCASAGIEMLDGYESLRPILRNDAVDALVCALVARVVELDPQTRPDPKIFKDEMQTILEEGWIHLPPDGHSLSSFRPDGE